MDGGHASCSYAHNNDSPENDCRIRRTPVITWMQRSNLRNGTRLASHLILSIIKTLDLRGQTEQEIFFLSCQTNFEQVKGEKEINELKVMVQKARIDAILH